MTQNGRVNARVGCVIVIIAIMCRFRVRLGGLRRGTGEKRGTHFPPLWSFFSAKSLALSRIVMVNWVYVNGWEEGEGERKRGKRERKGMSSVVGKRFVKGGGVLTSLLGELCVVRERVKKWSVGKREKKGSGEFGRLWATFDVTNFAVQCEKPFQHSRNSQRI